MSEQSTARLGWIKLPLWLLAAPAIYVLSSGPVTALYGNHWLPEFTGNWIQTLYAPLGLLAEHPLLEKPLVGYWRWWDEALKAGFNG
ncbi:MAG: hypothetical protein WAW39_09115 [Prosthecobacter sp.]|uniref:hypothetical protein n=1 Tax=Prosthecobacter sp. TaxID=1965333 RepID=UPI003BAFF9AE